MKQQVDRLIANTLLDEGVVYLQGVGTLILYRCAAKLLSAKQLQSPYRELRLVKEQQGESLTTYISRVANVSEERASDIYAEWLEQSLRNDILTIEGVCCIEKGALRTLQAFEDMANPNGRGTIRVNPRTNYFIHIVAALCMSFALGVAGYVLYTNSTLDKLFIWRSIAPASEAFEGCYNVEAASQESIASVVVEEPVVEASMVEEPVALEQPVEESSVVAEVVAPIEPAIQPIKSGRSYAVWGVYKELQNAKNAKNWLATRIPEIDGVDIYDYNGRYMVALCELSSRAECVRKVLSWKSQHVSCKSVWVYTK